MSRSCLSILFLSLVLVGPSLVLADGGPEHQATQPRPILLGTSGGSPDDTSGPYCCGGTLGSLVTDGSGNLYILSNNHVIARFNSASIGEPIHQPALIDTGCFASPAQLVATLSDYIEISENGVNLVDAAIASVEPGTVDTSGAILDIGPVSSTTLAPSLGQGVKKSGRTSGLTTGTIDAVNVTINVGYRARCNGGKQIVATFADCFRTTSGFSQGGDSGSLIVENTGNSPRPVGLLFAGNSAGVTFGNPIDTVLSELGVSFVGGSPPPPPATGSIAGTVSSSADGTPVAGASVSLDTGESTTTAGNGSYSFSDVAVGTRTVTASASGFTGDSSATSVTENQTSTVNLFLDPIPAGSGAIAECVVYETYGGQGATKHLSLVVRVVDDLGNPVAGASVSIELLVGGNPATGTASTDGAGNASFTLHNAANTCYVTTITALSAPGGLGWNGVTPPNGFQKGVDASPDEDCLGSGDGCGGAPLGGVAGGGASVPLPSEAALQAAMATQDLHAPGLMQNPNVVGTGTSWNDNGQPVIEIYVRQGPAAGLPASLGGVPTRTVVTGEIEAF